MTSLNETNVLLAIHPTAFERSDSADQKLPLTVYESIIESSPSKDDNSMQVDGEESSNLKFRPVPYSIETDEAEMIAINFVSKGAGSAAAVATSQPAPAAAPEPPVEDRKGKKRATPEASQPKPRSTADLEILSTEEQDQIANLTTRLNSVKMLQSRLAQLQAFASSLPASYLTDGNIPLSPESPDSGHLSHLRNLQALLTRLSLLSPTSTSPGTDTALEAASRAQGNDVTLTQLLSTLNKDVQGLQELGKTFSIVDQARQSKRKTGASGFDTNMIGGMAGDFMGPGGRGMLV
jgi:COP9 signalosome complex subunit 6